MAAASTVPTDAEDRDRLRSLRLTESDVDELIRVKRNDPEIRRLCGLEIGTVESDGAGESTRVSAAKRMGQIIGQAKHLEGLQLKVPDHPATSELGAELQSNRSISFLALHLENPDVDVSSFLPFLRDNATMTHLFLGHCSLQSAVDLSNAVLERGEDAWRYLSLHRTPLGDVDLDQRLALRNLMSLSLDKCGVGKRACASLANLLSDRQSKLFILSLTNNFIGDEAVSILVDSLAGNTTLRTLELTGNELISRDGWSRLLRLVCNCEDVAKSNHCLFNLGIFGWGPESDATTAAATTAAAIAALGANDANLLRASLEMNRSCYLLAKHTAAIKRKMIWCHARGDLNIGEERAIDVGVLPRILAWFAGRSNGTMPASFNITTLRCPKQRCLQSGLVRCIASFAKGQR
ncbi:hypothetical protein ACHAXT_011604 [Thalassiosira profunda]